MRPGEARRLAAGLLRLLSQENASLGALSADSHTSGKGATFVPLATVQVSS